MASGPFHPWRGPGVNCAVGPCREGAAILGGSRGHGQHRAPGPCELWAAALVLLRAGGSPLPIITQEPTREVGNLLHLPGLPGKWWGEQLRVGGGGDITPIFYGCAPQNKRREAGGATLSRHFGSTPGIHAEEEFLRLPEVGGISLGLRLPPPSCRGLPGPPTRSGWLSV